MAPFSWRSRRAEIEIKTPCSDVYTGKLVTYSIMLLETYDQRLLLSKPFQIYCFELVKITFMLSFSNQINIQFILSDWTLGYLLKSGIKLTQSSFTDDEMI